jgi:hypothetical protein
VLGSPICANSAVGNKNVLSSITQTRLGVRIRKRFASVR